MSLDGYVAGPNQSRENPLGEGASGLHDWGFATRTFRSLHGLEGGKTGLDDEHAARSVANVGAEIMGAEHVRAGPRPVGRGAVAGVG
jgi:hypothetical protein